MRYLKEMDKSVIGVLGVILLIIICIAGFMKRDLFTIESKSPEAQKIESYLSQQVENKNFSGSVLVESKGKILVNKGYGMANYEHKVPNTSKTKFNIGSITKTITATAIMQLVEKNKISLEDTIDKYIQGYPQGSKIHISDLLSQKSGIPDYEEFPEFMDTTMRLYRTPDQIIESFKDKPLEFEPGSKYKYSNSAFILLGYVIERATNGTYEDYVKENIFKPLEMNDTEVAGNKKLIENRAEGYSVNNKEILNCDFLDNSNEFGAGGIYSTVEDLYKWHKAINSNKILKKESWDKMLTPYSESYGYGWLTGDLKFDNVNKKVIGHNGLIFGFSSVFFNYVNDDTVVIILSNFDNLKEGNIAVQAAFDLTRIVDGTYK